MKLIEKIDFDIINKLRFDGYIKTSVHPSGELTIYNYTEKAVYDKFWTPETLQCRGLIADNSGNIVSRPFSKFFNLGENLQSLPDEPFEVYEKLDGSLGITYFHDGQYHIASRGSFTSPQAIYATEMLRSSGILLCEDVTYLFEIIYPENRIVVNYGEEESLNLIGVIETCSGFEHRQTCGKFWAANFWPPPLKVVKKYDGIKDIETLKKLNEKNKEGFVIHFESGLRIKIKFDDYVKLHSIITKMTKRKIWEFVKEGKSFYEFIENIPDELF
jgi:RNA ligase